MDNMNISSSYLATPFPVGVIGTKKKKKKLAKSGD